MANQDRDDTRNVASASEGGGQPSAGIDPNKAFARNASGVTQRATDGTKRPADDDQGSDGTVDMASVIDKAGDKSVGDLPRPQGDKAQEEADRTLAATRRMSTGNTPQAGDDPQHTKNGTMTPMPAETGGRGGSSVKADRTER